MLVDITHFGRDMTIADMSQSITHRTFLLEVSAEGLFGKRVINLLRTGVCNRSVTI
jgi:hypothetical protein